MISKLKWFVVNMDRWREQRLLRRCAADDAHAQQEFAWTSYLRQIRRTASETNHEYNSVIGSEELGELCMVLTVEIYDAWATLPHWRRNLYMRIDEYVRRAVTRYIRS
jgi:hypothetical protein